MGEQIIRFYEFGPFRLVPGERQLMRDDKPLPLSPKAFDTLVMLVQRNGHAVKKNDLIEMLWPDAVVEENNLNQYVSALRKILNDGGPGERYIETVRRYGYRFISDVRETRDEAKAVLVYKQSRTHVVLKGEQVEEISAVAGPAVNARVTSRTTRRLFVGSFAVVGVVLLSSLVTLGLYFAGETRARRIAPESTHHSENPAARQEYLAGRAAWNKRTSAGIFESIEHFERAIEQDPQSALALNGLADSYAFDAVNWRKSETLATRALELDPSLAEPHATLGFIRTFWEWNKQEGERELEEAIRLNPNYATARQWYAMHLVVTGRAQEAEVEMARALEIEPQSPVMLADMGQVLYFNHKYDEAIKFCQKALSIDPGFFNAHQYLYEIYTAKGLSDGALQEFLTLDKTSGVARAPIDPEKLTRAYRTGGKRAMWTTVLLTLRQHFPDEFESARYYSRLEEKTKALHFLQLAIARHDFRSAFVIADPAFDNVHSGPEFALLVKRIGLLQPN